MRSETDAHAAERHRSLSLSRAMKVVKAGAGSGQAQGTLRARTAPSSTRASLLLQVALLQVSQTTYGHPGERRRARSRGPALARTSPVSRGVATATVEFLTRVESQRLP